MVNVDFTKNRISLPEPSLLFDYDISSKEQMELTLSIDQTLDFK